MLVSKCCYIDADTRKQNIQRIAMNMERNDAPMKKHTKKLLRTEKKCLIRFQMNEMTNNKKKNDCWNAIKRNSIRRLKWDFFSSCFVDASKELRSIKSNIVHTTQNVEVLLQFMLLVMLCMHTKLYKSNKINNINGNTSARTKKIIWFNSNKYLPLLKHSSSFLNHHHHRHHTQSMFRIP